MGLPQDTPRVFLGGGVSLLAALLGVTGGQGGAFVRERSRAAAGGGAFVWAAPGPGWGRGGPAGREGRAQGVR